MKKNKVDYVIGKLRKKIWINRIQKDMTCTFSIGATGVFVWVLTGHILPIVYLLKKIVFFIAVMLPLGIIVGLCSRPSLRYTILVGDGLGLQNRLSTYMEYRNEEDSIIEVFKEEVEEALDEKDIVKDYKICFPWKIVMLGFFILVLSLGLYFLPSRGREDAQKRETIHQDLMEESKKLEEARKEIEEDLSENHDKVQEPEYKILLSLQNLEKKLNRSYDYQHAAAYIADTQKKVMSYNEEIEKKNRERYAGIFNGIDEEHKSLKSAIAANDIDKACEILKKEDFTVEDKKKIRENIEKIKKGFDEEQNEYKDSLTNEIKTALEEEKMGEKLSELLQRHHTIKKEFQIAEQTTIKLQSMKERVMDKSSTDGFKSFDGSEKGTDFARGENESTENGEASNANADELALGNEGNKSMGDANGLGGGSGKAYGSSDEAKEGKVEKQELATRLGVEAGETSYVQSTWQETGEIINKKADQVVSIEGESQELDRLYKNFKEEGMEYVLKQEIPLEYKELVIHYFDTLYGGK